MTTWTWCECRTRAVCIATSQLVPIDRTRFIDLTDRRHLDTALIVTLNFILQSIPTCHVCLRILESILYSAFYDKYYKMNNIRSELIFLFSNALDYSLYN